MNYYVKRGDQEYGPYTLAVLQQYVSQGNIAPNDLARSEAMIEWVLVSSIIGNVAVSAPASFGATPVNAAAQPANLPPKLHWAIVLVVGIVTIGLFIVIWLFVQAAWLHKVKPQTKTLMFLIVYVAASFGAGFFAHTGIATLLQLAGFAFYLIGVFSMSSDIEEAFTAATKIDRGLSGVMTFFFGAIYFQYVLNELREDVENNAAVAAAV